MRKFIELPPSGRNCGASNVHLNAQLVDFINPLSDEICAVTLKSGREFHVNLPANEVKRLLLEADEDAQAFELYKKSKREILDWFDFRVEHLKKRRDEQGETSADVRLSEVEGMRSFVKGKLE